jgi:hypothetical protein
MFVAREHELRRLKGLKVSVDFATNFVHRKRPKTGMCS